MATEYFTDAEASRMISELAEESEDGITKAEARAVWDKMCEMAIDAALLELWRREEIKLVRHGGEKEGLIWRSTAHLQI